MTSESNNKNSKAQGSFHKQMIIIFGFLVVFVSTIIIAPKDSGVAIDEYIRSTKPKTSQSHEVIKLPKFKFSDLKVTLDDAKMEIEESEEEALAKTEEELQEKLSDVESTVRKAMKHFLRQKGISPEKGAEIEASIVKELETSVRQRIEREANVIVEDAEDDLDTTVTNDINQEIDTEDIESDVIALRDYFTKEAQEEIEYAGKIIKNNIRGIVESIEKKVINEKLGLDVSEKELEDSELQSKVTSVAEELVEQEQAELQKMERNVFVDVNKVNDHIQSVLEDFLSGKKGMSSSEVKQISDEVSKKFKDMVSENINYGSQEVKEEVNEIAQFELNNIIEEDKSIIQKAKNLGMHIPYTENKSEVDVIEGDIQEVKKGLNQYLKESIALVVKDLKEDLTKMVKDIETDVFEKKGISVTQSELENLVTTETNED